MSDNPTDLVSIGEVTIPFYGDLIVQLVIECLEKVAVNNG